MKAIWVFFKQCSKSGLLKSPVAAKWRSMGPDHKDFQNKVYGVRPYRTDFLRSKHIPVFTPSGSKVHETSTQAFDFHGMRPTWIFMGHRHIFRKDETIII